jgi:iron complex transport system permease protein
MRLVQSANIGLLLLTLTLLLVALASMTFGAISMGWWDVLLAMFGASDNPQWNWVVQEIRLPRLVLGVLVGAGLAVAGAAMQGLFRNPLADPGLVGVSTGAALAAVTVIVLGGSWLSSWTETAGYYALPFAAFLGGLLVTWLIYQIASKDGRTDVSLMLLAGIAINAIAGALTGILTYYASDEALRSLTFWSMGSIASASWRDVWLAGIPILAAIILLPYFAKALNALLMGERVSQHLGFNVTFAKRGIIVLTALSVGAAVAVSGVIGFVGLVAPHLVRLLLGPDHRWVLPGSALMGAILVVLSDSLARMIVAPAELPIGLVMAAIGGPFFLWLLLNRRNRVGF